jgi:glycosyltransferase involved in cell wall biosynthesis
VINPFPFSAVLFTRLCHQFERLLALLTPRRQVSPFGMICEIKPPAASSRRIAMISYSFYESDNRVRRYAETLVERGDWVEVYSLAESRNSANTALVNGVIVHRLQIRKRDEKGPLHYAVRLLRFLAVCSLVMAWRFPSRRYELIHVHNVPDFLVFAAWLPKIAGSRVILDIHDIVPEFFMNKFRKSEDAFVVQLLRLTEKVSARFADYVIVSNDLWREKLVSRSVSPDRCSVFLNHVDERIFFPRARSPKNGARLIVFPGGLQWHQGLDIAIEAFSQLVQSLPDVQFHIYGDGDRRTDLERQSLDLGLQGRVIFWDPVPITEVPDILAGADLGVVPKRADSFGNEAYSTKIMEFMSMGLPVVASRTRVDTYYFNDSLVRFFTSSDAGEMASAMKEILEDESIRERLTRNGLRYVEQHGWRNRKQDYLRLVDELISGRIRDTGFEASLQKS